jgi:positive regulator of sigma E activity
MIERGKVESISETGIVEVRCFKYSGCGSCAAGSLCSVDGKSFQVTYGKNQHLKIGDVVEFYLHPGKTIFSGFLVFILPLFLFAAGYFLTGSIFNIESEGFQSLGGLVGLFGGFLIAYLFKILNGKQFQPKVEKVISRST